MRTIAALAAICALAICTTAQGGPAKKPETVDLRFLGVPAEVALREFADSAGLELRIDGAKFELDQLVWVSAKGVTPGHGARLLFRASGLNVCIEKGTVTVRRHDERGRYRVVKGYDVSVIAGQYIQYVNEYGPPANVQDDGEKAAKGRTAAEHLASLLSEVGSDYWEEDVESSVVGDRILITATPELHTRIREFLDRVMSEQGGECRDHVRERVQLDALVNKSGKTELDECPIGSVIANLCAEAGAEFVMDQAFSEELSTTHITWNGTGTYHEQLTDLLSVHLPGARMASLSGVVFFGREGYLPFGSERVFEVGNLLKKLEVAYQHQRTKAGKADGFAGSLAEAGGVDVIADALDWQLFEQDLRDRVKTYGSRIIVGGGPTTTDAAEVILKEMGWEPPEK